MDAISSFRVVSVARSAMVIVVRGDMQARCLALAVEIVQILTLALQVVHRILLLRGRNGVTSLDRHRCRALIAGATGNHNSSAWFPAFDGIGGRRATDQGSGDQGQVADERKPCCARAPGHDDQCKDLGMWALIGEWLVVARPSSVAKTFRQ